MTNSVPDIFKGNILCLFFYMDIDIVSHVVNRGQKHPQNLEVIMAYD